MHTALSRGRCGRATETEAAARKRDGWNIGSKFCVWIMCAGHSWLQISRQARTERKRKVWGQLERGDGAREEEVLFEGAEVGTVKDCRWRGSPMHC